jgi:predicted helicase
LDKEIRTKFDKGYPKENILFEDSQTAVLIQHGQEVARADMANAEALDKLLQAFLNYQRPEVQDFQRAIELFKADIPQVIDTLRALLDSEAKTNPAYHTARTDFLELCRQSINPIVSEADVREMMIQHILTHEIFISIFGEDQFHRENNIAAALQQVVEVFYKGMKRRIFTDAINSYYAAIKARAAEIHNHHEKQRFLKVVYENFYKVYNPKAADRMGIVYTPNEIVRFMIEATDVLLERHFGRTLGSPDVQILDPCTGTGTFITEIIDYLPKAQLAQKYAEELHANELGILPYYIANLNIEYTYRQKMGHYAPFDNLVFVDTLDNMGFGYAGKQTDLFGLSAENLARIKRQNKQKISVVIGNPPYNAAQATFNSQNPNRAYTEIDKRIKDSFIKAGKAQNKSQIYDMYVRFYRWAIDRIADKGIVAYVTNRSFIDSRTFDGFRKVLEDTFPYIYIVDLGGDVRANPKLSGTKHNVFGIQTGVAIMFLVKK